MNEPEVESLLGKKFADLDPEENDLKALAAYAAGRGLLDPAELRAALDADLRESPLYFLAGLSGKTFGETVAPELCAFWLRAEGDAWQKMPNRERYDVAWAPGASRHLLRIELKASSEHPGFRFQQVRDPRAGDQLRLDYDGLLCMGVTAGSVGFWLIPADDVARLIATGVLERQHGGSKTGLSSNTYWIVTDRTNRDRLAGFAVAPEELRQRCVELHSKIFGP